MINNNNFLNFDLKKDSIELIEQLISKSILGHSRPTMQISTNFFRARIITEVDEKELQTVKSIYYPDWTEINPNKYTLGRCNDMGQNFFYSSNYLGATIKELDPQDNDLVLIGVFDKKHKEIKIPCQFAGIETLKLNSHRESLLKDYKYENNNDLITEKIISSKFQEKILPEEKFKYKLTIAITNILLKNENIGCLIYPSVATDFEYANYGIKPNYVDHLLYCREIYVYKIKKTNIEYTLIPERFGYKFFYNLNNIKNSLIDWRECNNDDKTKILTYKL